MAILLFIVVVLAVLLYLGFRSLATVLALTVLVPVGTFFGYAWLTSCRGEERAVYEEFPQYAPRQPDRLDPVPDPRTQFALGFICIVRYTTPDSKEEVLSYYSERLRENGWDEVEVREPARESSSPSPEPTDLGQTVAQGPSYVTASREGYYYIVAFPHPASTTTIPSR